MLLGSLDPTLLLCSCKGGGNCTAAKGHPVSCDPDPPFWEQLSVGEFLSLSQQIWLRVGKRAKPSSFSGPSPYFLFVHSKGLCFSLWFLLYVGLALGD